ncbi:S8 family serine peptidase [uncultured Chitinophaga sp.]|jgi:Subtilisin-like serine proteases|uniref:S8 family serine peptidase n=1 Tax=uncultured Chitinophaga sp. TaxID=339340 RepID=UPI00261EF28F|nr:S8 family serine peptidase [uncultured Chitinophaga sp.]
MKKIIIIDQGVDAGHTRLKDCRISGDTIRKRNESFLIERGVFHDITGHGTAIAAIIHKLAPDMELYMLKLTSETGIITEDLLCKGLNWCLAVEGAVVVNISLGIATNTPSVALHEACQSLHKAGITVVAAVHNFPREDCYPAHFPFVYGVACGLIRNKHEYNFIGDGKTNILAKGTSQRVAWKDNAFKITAGTSYATAHFSGILGAAIARNPGMTTEEISAYVKEHSNPEIQELSYIKRDDALLVSTEKGMSPGERDARGRVLFTAERTAHVNRLAVFPSSEKELGTLLEFPGEVTAKVTLVIDYPRMRANVMQTQKSEDQGPVVRRDLLPHEYDDFDTLAVGYFLDVPVDANILFGTRLLINCIKRNKNFVVLDNEVHDYIHKLVSRNHPSYSGRILMPAINKEMIRELEHFQYMPQVSAPVLSLIGTGSKQGKITAQLRIRQILKRAGYDVSHVSTEPQGVLLGSSFIFPYGYKGNVEAKLTSWNRLLDTAMKCVQYYNQPDIILTGIQGGILPRVTYVNEAAGGSVLTSMHYLMGVRPDAVICAINPADPSDLIRQTIQTVYNFCKVPTLMCVMTPWEKQVETNAGHAFSSQELLPPAEMRSRMDAYAAELDLPVIDIMDNKNDALVLDVIQRHFS